MSYYSNFGTHKVVEVNQSTGLRTGHMVAQTPFLKNSLDGEGLDNGYILALSSTADELVLAASDAKHIFMHFTEEHMPVLGRSAGLKYFTVPYIKGADEDGKEDYCYPRAIALYTNDTWTTDNFKGDLPAAGELAWATVEEGQLKIVEVGEDPLTGHVFKVVATTLPDAVTPAGQFTYLGLL